MSFRTFLFRVLPALFVAGSNALSAQYFPEYYEQGYSAHATFWENDGQFVDTNGDPIDALVARSTGGPVTIFPQTGSVVSYLFPIGVDTVIRIDQLATGESASLMEPTLVDQAPGIRNYYYPHEPSGVLGVENWYRCIYEGLFPNVNLHYYSSPSGMRMALECLPGFDPADIMFQFSGQDSLTEEINGALRLYAQEKYVLLQEALAYQVDNGSVVSTLGWTANWERLSSNGLATLEFESYDPALSLILLIGPPPLGGGGGQNYNTGLDWSTTFGDDNGLGFGGDHITGADHGPDGSIYVCGNTRDVNFPAAAGIAIYPYVGGWDMFYGRYRYAPGNAALDAANTFTTFFGGTGDEKPHALIYGVVDDKVYIGGWSQSSDAPILPSTDPNDGTFWQGTRKGSRDGFLMKVDPATGIVDRSTYFGGDGEDAISSLVEISTGTVFFSGVTASSTGVVSTTCTSTATGFPLCDPAGSNYWQTTNGGGWDSFIARVDGSFQLTLSTFYGGSGNDVTLDMAYQYRPAGSSGPKDRVILVGRSTGTVPQGPNGDFVMNGNGQNSGFLAAFVSTGVIHWATNIQGLNSLQAAVVDDSSLVVMGFTRNYLIDVDGPLPISNGCTDLPGVVSICDPGGNAYTDNVDIEGDHYIGEFMLSSGQLIWSTLVGDWMQEQAYTAFDQFSTVNQINPFGLYRFCDLEVDATHHLYAMGITAQAGDALFPGSYPTPNAPPFYNKGYYANAGESQSDVTLHGFNADRSMFWGSQYGAYFDHLTSGPNADYYMCLYGSDFGSDLVLVEDECLYWVGSTGGQAFPWQCPYPGTSYCELFLPLAPNNAVQGFVTRMSMVGVGVGISGMNESSSNVTAFPNPATDQLFIQYQGMALDRGRLAVFDIQGKLSVVLTVVNGRTDLRGLSVGVYAARVENSTGKALGTVRFQVQR